MSRLVSEKLVSVMLWGCFALSSIGFLESGTGTIKSHSDRGDLEKKNMRDEDQHLITSSNPKTFLPIGRSFSALNSLLA